jgi:hypothetical protein
MDNFKGYQLVIHSTYTANEKQAGISSVDNFRVFILKKVAHLCPSSKNQLSNVLNNLGLRFGRQCGKPFGESDFPYSTTK